MASRRLVPFQRRQVNAHPDPHLYPAVINTRVTEQFPTAGVPDRVRDGDFNTRPSRYRIFMSGGALSQYILREGFERPIIRVGKPRSVAVSTGDMVPFRNPSGNMPTPEYKAWGTILDAYARGEHR